MFPRVQFAADLRRVPAHSLQRGLREGPEVVEQQLRRQHAHELAQLRG